MKIAMITDVYYPYVKGGVEKRISKIAEQLSKSDDVHVYCMKFWEGDRDLKLNENLTLHGVCKSHSLYSSEGKRKVSQAISFSLNLIKPLFEEDYDIVEVSEFPFFHIFTAKAYCLIKKKPLIATWHEVWSLKYWIDYAGFFKGTVGFFIEKICSLLPDEFIVNSGHTRKKLGKGKIIYNGVDIDKIKSTKKSLEKYDILYAGRLSEHKNVDVLIKAVSILKKTNPIVRVGIIGDGPEKTKLKTLSERLKLSKNIDFPGFVDEVYPYMKSSKIFVLPSEREGFGMVVMEALACGTPVITVNHPNNASVEFVSDGKDGYVVELNKEKIAEKIAFLLSDKDALEKMSVEAKKDAEDFCWERIAKGTRDFYKNILDRYYADKSKKV